MSTIVMTLGDQQFRVFLDGKAVNVTVKVKKSNGAPYWRVVKAGTSNYELVMRNLPTGD